MPLITKNEIERAAENGVGYHTLATRVYNNGWEVEEAITTPLKKHSNPWAGWKETAIANGISSATFYNRIKRGWEPETAASTPVK